MDRITPTAGWSWAAMAAVFAAAMVLAPVDAVAQERPSAAASSLRAVETLHPSSGERTRSLLRPLTPSERLGIEAALAAADRRPGRVDGTFDDATTRALRRFQDEHGLQPCGCVDLPTTEALGIGVRVVMTEVASAGDQGRVAGHQGRDPGQERVDRSREASTAAGVEVVYPSAPAPEPVREETAGPEAVGARPGAMPAGAAAGRDVAPVSVHRGGAFVSTSLGVPFFVVDSAGNLVPFTPRVPVTTPMEGGRGRGPGASGFSRHRVPLPPIRGGGAPPAGGGGSGG